MSIGTPLKIFFFLKEGVKIQRLRFVCLHDGLARVVFKLGRKMRKGRKLADTV